MWIAYMSKAMKGVEEVSRTVPEGIVQARINAETGLRDPDGSGITEYFYHEFLPAERDSESSTAAPPAAKPADEVKSQLF
jgi:membrane carboxypeptidase/penicillin-binding protein